MSLQQMALMHMEQQLIRKLENITDPRNENNFSSIKNFVKYTRIIKELTRREFKIIANAAKNVPLTKLTRNWKNEMRYKMKAIRFTLQPIVFYVTSKQLYLKTIEDRYTIRNMIIKNLDEDYGDD